MTGSISQFSFDRDMSEPSLLKQAESGTTSMVGISVSNLSSLHKEPKAIVTGEIVETFLPEERGLYAENNFSSHNQTICELNPHAKSFIPLFDNLDIFTDSSDIGEDGSLIDDLEDPMTIFKGSKGEEF